MSVEWKAILLSNYLHHQWIFFNSTDGKSVVPLCPDRPLHYRKGLSILWKGTETKVSMYPWGFWRTENYKNLEILVVGEFQFLEVMRINVLTNELVRHFFRFNHRGIVENQQAVILSWLIYSRYCMYSSLICSVFPIDHLVNLWLLTELYLP